MFRIFLSSLFSGKGEDYVILSKWNMEFDSVTHHWLLLDQHHDTRELGLFSAAPKNAFGALKKILKKQPMIDKYETPDRNVIKGNITHSVDGSVKKHLVLIIFTKNLRLKRNNKHEINLYSPDND